MITSQPFNLIGAGKSQRNLQKTKSSTFVGGELYKDQQFNSMSSTEARQKALTTSFAPRAGSAANNQQNRANLGGSNHDSNGQSSSMRTSFRAKLLLSSASARTLLVPNTRKKEAKYCEDFSSDSFGMKSAHWWEDSTELTKAEPSDDDIKGFHNLTMRQSHAMHPADFQVIQPQAAAVSEEHCPLHHNTSDESLDQTTHEHLPQKMDGSPFLDTVSSILSSRPQEGEATMMENTRLKPKYTSEDSNSVPTVAGEASTIAKLSTNEVTNPEKGPSRKRTPKRIRSLDNFLELNQRMIEEASSSIRNFGAWCPPGS